MRSMVEGAATALQLELIRLKRRQAMRAPILTFKRARALRRDMSLPEVVLWDHLRGHRLNGLRFRRQHPIGPYPRLLLPFGASCGRD
jgi:hypothetical protein